VHLVILKSRSWPRSCWPFTGISLWQARADIGIVLFLPHTFSLQLDLRPSAGPALSPRSAAEVGLLRELQRQFAGLDTSEKKCLWLWALEKSQRPAGRETAGLTVAPLTELITVTHPR
jgi:hypothetical protein